LSLSSRPLLPVGLSDLVPPLAGLRLQAMYTACTLMAQFGYLLAAPPLLEFETDLNTGAEEGDTNPAFRLMDPLTRSMMVLRRDITPQISRLASTRLKNTPRPLRLSYAGQVCRAAGNALSPEREFMQLGAEYFGGDSAWVTAEIIMVAFAVLKTWGISGITADICAPAVLESLLREAALTPEQIQFARQAAAAKDSAGFAALPPELAAQLELLKKGEGASIPLLKPYFEKVAAVQAALAQLCPDLAISVDFLEHQGFSYQSGLCFSLFAAGIPAEIGRGGVYRAGDESACGFSLYLDPLLEKMRPAPTRPIKSIAATMPLAQRLELHAQGFDTIHDMQNKEIQL
jgi:ATP phosphoribosyltransferase regulatory subunit